MSRVQAQDYFLYMVDKSGHKASLLEEFVRPYAPP
jgi:hypothetical protein